jgi:hypothetical protein
MKGRETAAGIFVVVEKDKDHHSNLYDNAWMPNMLRITWSGIALHGGPPPGYAASHGCLRMPFGFAEKLFDKTRMGMRVIIAPNDARRWSFPIRRCSVPNGALAAAPMRAERLTRDAAEAARTADPKSAAVLTAREVAPLTASLRKLETLKTRADQQTAARMQSSRSICMTSSLQRPISPLRLCRQAKQWSNWRRGHEKKQFCPAAQAISPWRGTQAGWGGGVALNQLINVAVAEKVSALRTESYIAARAARADVPKALTILKRAGGRRPTKGDEMPRSLSSGRRNGQRLYA